MMWCTAWLHYQWSNLHTGNAQGWQPSLQAGAALRNVSWDLLFPSGFARMEALCWPAQEVPFDFLLDPANSHRLWTRHSGTNLQWVPPPSQQTEMRWQRKIEATFTASKVKGSVFRCPENHTQLSAKASLFFNDLRKVHLLPWWELACEEYQELQP